jgi:hypothetical protein
MEVGTLSEMALLHKREDAMKALSVLTFMLGILVTPVYAQQPGTLTFNGNVFDAPSQGAGYAQGPGSYGQPAKPRTYHHVKRHTYHKHSAS